MAFSQLLGNLQDPSKLVSWNCKKICSPSLFITLDFSLTPCHGFVFFLQLVVFEGFFTVLFCWLCKSSASSYRAFVAALYFNKVTVAFLLYCYLYPVHWIFYFTLSNEIWWRKELQLTFSKFIAWRPQTMLQITSSRNIPFPVICVCASLVFLRCSC